MSTDEPSQAKRPHWWPWVHEQMVTKWGRVNMAKLARDAGLDRSNLYTWQRGGDVDPANVGAVAKALEANPIEAYIAAGYFTAEEFDEYRTAGAERALSNEVLAREVLERMNRAEPVPSGSGTDVARSLRANRSVDVARPRPESGRKLGSNGSSWTAS